jgi:hypothetical protein
MEQFTETYTRLVGKEYRPRGVKQKLLILIFNVKRVSFIESCFK